VSDQEPLYEYQKWTWEHNRDEARRAHDRHEQFLSELNETTIKSSELALRTCVLINGGDVITILAFIGGLVSQNQVKLTQLDGVTNSLSRFALGVGLAAIGMVMAYLTHYFTIRTYTSQKLIWDFPYVQSGSTQNIGHLQRL
jgi:hypothetical protein